MKTLGDYSDLCRRLDDTLIKVACGEDFPTKTISACFEVFLLESDGLVKINGFEPKKHGTFSSVEITQKGRELLNRGGYCDFDPEWQPNLFDKF